MVDFFSVLGPVFLCASPAHLRVQEWMIINLRLNSISRILAKTFACSDMIMGMLKTYQGTLRVWRGLHPVLSVPLGAIAVNLRMNSCILIECLRTLDWLFLNMLDLVTNRVSLYVWYLPGISTWPTRVFIPSVSSSTWSQSGDLLVHANILLNHNIVKTLIKTI